MTYIHTIPFFPVARRVHVFIVFWVFEKTYTPGELVGSSSKEKGEHRGTMKFLHALQREVFALHARAPLNLRAPTPLPVAAREQRGRASLGSDGGAAQGGTRDSRARHGQGCGEGCGCVLDIQVLPRTRAYKHTIEKEAGAPASSFLSFHPALLSETIVSAATPPSLPTVTREKCEEQLHFTRESSAKGVLRIVHTTSTSLHMERFPNLNRGEVEFQVPHVAERTARRVLQLVFLRLA